MDGMTPPEMKASPAPASERPPGLVKRLYAEERRAWRRHYRKYFKYAARALGLGFVAGFIYFALWPGQERKALDLVVKALEDIPVGGSPLVLALSLFTHNSQASLIALASGAVPFLFLPIFDPLINGAVLGLLVSISRHQGLDVPRLVMTQILPHGVFELTAVIYVTSVGLYLSEGMGKKVKAARKARTAASENVLENPADQGDAEPAGLVRNVVRSFVLVVLPLLLAAAAVEGFITPSLR